MGDATVPLMVFEELAYVPEADAMANLSRQSCLLS